MTHELKTWPEYFEAIWDGRKNFEYRLNDRDYQVGDLLHLREYDPHTSEYSGREIVRSVTYVLFPLFNTDPSLCCIMSLGPVGLGETK